MAEEMRLEKELTVAAPLDRTWRLFTDLGLFASCLPDAELHAADGAYTGRVTLGTDGKRVVCEATLRAVDQDDDEHVSTVQLHARQVDGPAIGSATVQSRCETADSSTRVRLNAEVLTSGHKRTDDTFDRAAREVFDRVGERLEQRAVEVPPAPAPEPAPMPAPPAPQAERALAPTSPGPQRGLAMLAAGILVIALLRWLLGRRR